MDNAQFEIKVYHGYGHTHKLTVFGHVFQRKSSAKQYSSINFFANITHLISLFRVKPCPFVPVRLTFGNQVIDNKTEYDGFFRFEFQAAVKVAPGWHQVQVAAFDGETRADSNGPPAGTCATGLIYVPHITQYAFISDIDDTIMISHSATIYRRLRELIMKNPRTRKTFPGMAQYYKHLSAAFTSQEKPNPFFYVSSSEWNLYDYLLETFRVNRLPEGAFLLSQLKRLKELLKTGRTGHEGKLLRLMRVIETFPRQKFVLFGDNSQQDPGIYSTIAEKYPDRIVAIYIRNAHRPHFSRTEKLLDRLRRLNIEVCQFNSSQEAAEHSRRIGLLE